MEYVIIIVKNYQDKYLLHKRSWNKKKSPGKYGIGCGGQINRNIGEEPLEAAYRELREELGIFGVHLKFLFEKKNATIYYLLWNGKYKNNYNEFIWINWVDRAKINQYDLCDNTRSIWNEYIDKHTIK